MLKTVFVGSCCMELHSHFQRPPKIGETVIGNKVTRHYTGKSINASAQFTFLSSPSYKPSILTSVGKDPNAQKIRGYLKKTGINEDLVYIDEKQPTGVAICMDTGNGKLSTVVHPCEVTVDTIRKFSSQISQCELLVTSFEISFDAAVEALKIAHENGVKTILNASPRISADQNLDLDFLKYVSALIVNEEEMESFGNIESILKTGIEVLVNTFGADGATFYEKGKHFGMSVAAPVVKVVDTNGAGDSFLGAFAYCVAKKMNYEDSSRIACGAASISVQKVGVQKSFPHIGHADLMPLF